MTMTLLKPHVKDIGGLEVRRLLPGHPHKMVGPFIFFDHMGPAEFAPVHSFHTRCRGRDQGGPSTTRSLCGGLISSSWPGS